MVGIIVRDKRKRPLVDSTPTVASKKIKVDVAVVPVGSSTPPIPTPPPPPPPAPTVTTPRSYTPPPNRDPRIKAPYTPIASLPTPIITIPSPSEEDDMGKFVKAKDSNYLINQLFKGTFSKF